MAYLKILLLFVALSCTQACMRFYVYQKRDPSLGLVYEYHDSKLPHPGHGFERVDGTNNNHSVPSTFAALRMRPDDPPTTDLRVCALTEPGRTEALHFLVLSSGCEDLRQYTSQPSDTQISESRRVYVPVSNARGSPVHVRICRGPGDIIYSTATLADTFCNPGHDSIREFMFYASQTFPDFCPLLTTPEGSHVQYERTAGVNGVTAVYRCVAGYDLQQGHTGRRTCNDQSEGRWTGPEQICERVFCESPPTVAHGEYVYVESDVALHSTVQLECHRGYLATAEDILICHRDGWSQQNGHCQRVNCGAPPLTDHGAYVDYLGQPSEYESTVILRCDDGFIASHSHPILTCLATGLWSSHGYHCRSPNCGDPGTPFNGRQIGNNFNEDAIVLFFCNAGFTLVGASVITCESGQWSAELPQCSVVPCLAPPYPDHGFWTWDAVDYGTILYQCLPGFTLEGYNSSKCYNGQWQRRNPICRAPVCDDPGIPEHGSRVGSQFHHQSVVQFFCDGGFVLEGDAMAICDAGQWTVETPTCQPVDCPELPAVENGVWFWDTYHPGRVQFWCLPGYELQGQSYSVCYEGRWRSTLPRCTACAIGQYKEGLNNEVCQRCPERSSTNSTATGSREECICQPGTRSSEDGSSCRDIGCPPFPPMENGRRGWQVYDFGIAISFECFPGYEIMGHHFSICQSDDTWSSEAPWCRPCPMGHYKEGVNNANCSQCPPNMITSSEASDSCECVPGYRPVENGIGCEVPICPCINPPEHGAVTVHGYMPGSAATYSCLPGFQLQGTVNSQCLSSGTWSHDMPLCVALSCPELEQPSNGIKLQTSDDNVIGTVVVFRCNTGYELLGDELLDCVENGGQAVWSAQPPLCVEA